MKSFVLYLILFFYPKALNFKDKKSQRRYLEYTNPRCWQNKLHFKCWFYTYEIE